jgi:hypothetical protein
LTGAQVPMPESVYDLAISSAGRLVEDRARLQGTPA